MIHALARGTIAKNETSDGLEAAYIPSARLTNENHGIVEIEKVENPLQSGFRAHNPPDEGREHAQRAV